MSTDYGASCVCGVWGPQGVLSACTQPLPRTVFTKILHPPGGVLRRASQQWGSGLRRTVCVRILFFFLGLEPCDPYETTRSDSSSPPRDRPFDAG